MNWRGKKKDPVPMVGLNVISYQRRGHKRVCNCTKSTNICVPCLKRALAGRQTRSNFAFQTLAEALVGSIAPIPLIHSASIDRPEAA
jgi:hypothetical protein